MQLKPGFGIGKQNQGPVSVSVYEPKLFLRNYFKTIREPSQITFAFRGGWVLRKILNILHKKGKLGGYVRGQMPKNANVNLKAP